jgi:hypothetical protein
MVIASHVIFGMHGFWLPNDPRGSWSEFVGAWDLFRYGRATKTSARRSVAGRSHDVTARIRAKGALKRAGVVLTGIQARAMAYGFADYASKSPDWSFMRARFCRITCTSCWAGIDSRWSN